MYGPSAFQRRVARYSTRLIYSPTLIWSLLSESKIFGNQKSEFVSILVRLKLFFHFWKPEFNFKNVQNSMKLLEITKPHRITCDTALESWRSIHFNEKVFYPPQKFFTPSFLPWANLFVWIFEKVTIFFIKKYASSAFQRRIARSSTNFSYF